MMVASENLNWLIIACALIAFGIGHEIFIYWLQWRFRFYTKIFDKFSISGFWIHGLELGGIWVIIGASLIGWFAFLPETSFHYILAIKFMGWLGALVGFGIMLAGLHELGWERMMKARLFLQNEPDWICTGIYRCIKHPMYHGSQISMFSFAFAFDSWLLFVCLLEMMILQLFLIRLESLPCS